MAESGRVPAPVNPIFPLDGCYSHPVWIPQTVHPRPHNAAPAQPSRWPNPWGKYWGHPVGCYAHLSYIEQRYVESDRCFCPGSRKIKAQRITRATYGDHGVIGKPIAPPNGSKDELPLDTNQEPSQASSSPVEPRSTDASDPVDATRATTGGSSPGANDKGAGSPFRTSASNDVNGNDNGVDSKASAPVHAATDTTGNAAVTTTSAAQLRAKQVAFLARQAQEERQAEQMVAERRRRMRRELGALGRRIARTTDRGERTRLQAIMEERLGMMSGRV